MCRNEDEIWGSEGSEPIIALCGGELLESVVLREINEDRRLRGLSKQQRSALLCGARWDVVRVHLVCGALGNLQPELHYEDDRKSCSPRQHRRFPRLGREIHDVSCVAARPARLACLSLASSRLVQCPVLEEWLDGESSSR